MKPKLHSRKSKLHPADDFGMLPQFLFLGIHEAPVIHEADRPATLETINLT
jgi:hypothetical protein